MAGAIWSAAPGDMHDYPARAFLRFFDNHGLLKLAGRPPWRTVAGGSRQYVSRLLRDGLFETRLQTPVRSIRRGPHSVTLKSADGDTKTYDDVVIAAHADQALAMLEDASPEEHHVLSSFRYSRNRAILHRDENLMPKRRRLWSSWNYISDLPSETVSAGAVTYWMNALQPLATKSPVFVSLNPRYEPRTASVLAEFDYAHPVFDPAAMAAQKRLWPLQGRRRTWFCGAYFGAGFHEDGIQSGLAMAEQLGGVRRPWMVAGESDRIHIGLSASPGWAQPQAAE
jgi:predicted NAD/FAD-binding protein